MSSEKSPAGASATPTTKIERLHSLASDPREQAAYAANLLPKERNAEVLLLALSILETRTDPALHAALVQKYAYYDANGTRRDPGGTIRIALLRVLRPISLFEDIPLFERAVSTYEFLFGEAAGDLRAAGLLALQEIDPTLAGYHCVRLLTDQYTSIMSGEPALTAAHVLIAQRQLLPLYGYLTREGDGAAEVIAESLRNLTDLPPSLLPALIERYRTSSSELILLGLFDLLLSHATRAEHLDTIFDFLQTTERYNLYRYLLLVLFRDPDEGIRQRLQAMLANEEDPEKVDIWREVETLG